MSLPCGCPLSEERSESQEALHNLLHTGAPPLCEHGHANDGACPDCRESMRAALRKGFEQVDVPVYAVGPGRYL